MSTLSGKTLGNVLIGDLIARGGMAEVYNGMHSTLNRRVAVKIMRDHVEEDPDSRARFAREARVIASIDHPNIIQIFDYDLIDGRPCIVMELVPGVSLGNYLKDLQKRGENLPHNVVAGLMKSELLPWITPTNVTSSTATSNPPTSCSVPNEVTRFFSARSCQPNPNRPYGFIGCASSRTGNAADANCDIRAQYLTRSLRHFKHRFP